jgi:hypothetical protein
MQQFVWIAAALWLLLQGMTAAQVGARFVKWVGYAIVFFAGVAVIVGFIPALEQGIDVLKGLLPD